MGSRDLHMQVSWCRKIVCRSWATKSGACRAALTLRVSRLIAGLLVHLTGSRASAVCVGMPGAANCLHQQLQPGFGAHMPHSLCTKAQDKQQRAVVADDPVLC